MRAFPAVVALAAIPLAVSACAGSHPPAASSSRPRDATTTLTSSRTILGGRVRCTARLRAPVQAGRRTGLEFTVRNVSSRPVKVPLAAWGFGLTLRSPDGTAYDTTVPAERAIVPYVPPTVIAPGASKVVHGEDVGVRWKGPLRITPECQRAKLPALRVGVAAPGPPPNARAALADVVAASGHLFDHCRPRTPGVAVPGRIDPPSGSAPPLRARCSISVHNEGRFLVAQALVVAPPDRRGVRVRQPYEDISLRRHVVPYEAIAWTFVVTKRGATTVDGATVDASRPADRMAPEWDWTGSRWQGPGGSRCGGELYAGGPAVEFISVCDS